MAGACSAGIDTGFATLDYTQAAVLGVVGALLAIPGAAMVQALLSEAGTRHDVIDNHLTAVYEHGRRRQRRAARASHPTALPVEVHEEDDPGGHA